MYAIANFILAVLVGFAIGKLIQIWLDRNDNDDHNGFDNHGFI